MAPSFSDSDNPDVHETSGNTNPNVQTPSDGGSVFTLRELLGSGAGSFNVGVPSHSLSGSLPQSSEAEAQEEAVPSPPPAPGISLREAMGYPYQLSDWIPFFSQSMKQTAWQGCKINIEKYCIDEKVRSVWRGFYERSNGGRREGKWRNEMRATFMRLLWIETQLDIRVDWESIDLTTSAYQQRSAARVQNPESTPPNAPRPTNVENPSNTADTSTRPSTLRRRRFQFEDTPEPGSEPNVRARRATGQQGTFGQFGRVEPREDVHVPNIPLEDTPGPSRSRARRDLPQARHEENVRTFSRMGYVLVHKDEFEALQRTKHLETRLEVATNLILGMEAKMRMQHSFIGTTCPQADNTTNASPFEGQPPEDISKKWTLHTHPNVVSLTNKTLLVCANDLDMFPSMEERDAGISQDGRQVCPICLDSLNGVPTMTTGTCNCIYHPHCFWTYFAGLGKCCACRATPSQAMYQYFGRSDVFPSTESRGSDDVASARLARHLDREQRNLNTDSNYDDEPIMEAYEVTMMLQFVRRCLQEWAAKGGFNGWREPNLATNNLWPLSEEELRNLDSIHSEMVRRIETEGERLGYRRAWANVFLSYANPHGYTQGRFAMIHMGLDRPEPVSQNNSRAPTPPSTQNRREEGSQSHPSTQNTSNDRDRSNSPIPSNFSSQLSPWIRQGEVHPHDRQERRSRNQNPQYFDATQFGIEEEENDIIESNSDGPRYRGGGSNNARGGGRSGSRDRDGDGMGDRHWLQNWGNRRS